MTPKEIRFFLEDILELKYTSCRREYRKVACTLLRKTQTDRPIRPLTGYILGRTLLVIKDGEVSELDKLVILDVHTREKLQIDHLRQIATPF